jgi:hypothetical protein
MGDGGAELILIEEGTLLVLKGSVAGEVRAVEFGNTVLLNF